MTQRNFLAFDFGAESGRSVLGTLADGRLSLDVTHRFANPNGLMNGRLQWNLLAQWEEIKVGLRKTAGTSAAKPVRLDGIGVDTWGVDFGLIGPGGDVLGNPTMYRDARNAPMMDRVFARVPREQVFAATGLQFMVFNTLYQLEALRHHAPHLLQQAESLLFMPDLFHYLLSGRRANEFSIASTSQLLDPRTGRWASELLTKLELPQHLLGEIVPSGTVLANLKSDVASECGFSDAPPIIAPASHDTASAIVAVPTEGGSWCYISSGTWSLMGVELDAPIINDQSLALNYTNEGGYGGTTRFLKNIMGLWLVQECRRQWTRDGHDHSYADLTQMAATAAPHGPLINPDDAPLLSPGDMPAKIESFCRRTKQTPPDSRGAYVRCCLESLALTYRKTLDGLEQILGRRIDVIHIVGGGTQNELLNQMTADACNRRVVTGPVEATAAGNILTQAMAIGAVKSLADARAIVRQSFDVKRYEPTDVAAWDAAYARFRQITA
jgi:rhamnulokinase